MKPQQPVAFAMSGAKSRLVLRIDKAMIDITASSTQRRGFFYGGNLNGKIFRRYCKT
jgi:hypothetical protein